MDAAEFKQQFLPYHRKLYRVAFRLTGNPQDAEDMVQEAYLKLWNKRDELADVLNTEAYCVTLIKNLCYDVLRRSQPDARYNWLRTRSQPIAATFAAYRPPPGYYRFPFRSLFCHRL